MRVLHVGLESTSTRLGGLNRYFAELVAAERRDGLDVTAVVLAAGGEARRAAHDEGFVVVGTPSASLLRAAVAVDRAVRRRTRPDVADLHFAGTSWVTAVAGALRGVPTVVHFQGPWADESAVAGAGRWNVAAKRVLERLVYARADRVVVLSAAFGRVLVERYGVAPWCVRVLTPGVDLERFTPGDRVAARDALEAPSGRVALSVRRLVPRMGLEVLLEAWSALSPGPDDLLAIVGDGPERASLAELARALGVERSVRLCGRVDDVALRQWYVAADVTVVPTLALEGFGLVVLESLACGTPVVGTDADGLAEALALAQSSPVRAGDAPALVGVLADALARPKDDASALAARRLAEPHGWASVARAHRALYDEVRGGEPLRRVVVLDHTAVLSGGELALARAVLGVGGAAHVHALLAVDGPLRARLEQAGATVEVLELDAATRTLHRGDVGATGASPRALLSTARYVVRLARRLRALRPDVVHANSVKAALYGGAAARLAGVPCVWHVRDRLEPPSMPASAARLVRLAARVLPTVVVANSASTLATVRTDGVVVPSPLDPSIVAPARVSGVPGPTRFAVVGRLAPWKGQRLAIEAFATAFATGDETLEIVGTAMFGEDAYGDGLAALVKDLGLEGRVTLRGFVDDVAGVLAEVDVLVHSSVEPEPFGQVVVEAMGAGCAVLVADAGGPAEVVTRGTDGLTYAMGDVEALTAGMRRLAKDPALRRRLGAAGEQTARRYTPAALAPLLVAAWDEAIERRPSRRARRHRRG